MDNTQANSPTSPFSDQPNPAHFFSGARREEICQAMTLDLLADKRFLVLNGEAGAGKSQLCQVLMERLPREWIPVYLENATSSYEDLLRHVCIDLGASPDSKALDFSWADEFNRRLRSLTAEGRRVVLILDQGEQVFSATLERLLQRCHLGNERDANVSVLTSASGGADDAGGNALPAFALILAAPGTMAPLLRQLASLDADNTADKSYDLPAMSLEETDKYVRFLLHAAGVGWNGHDAILGKKQVARIFNQAQGNFRRTNQIAATLLADALSPPLRSLATERKATTPAPKPQLWTEAEVPLQSGEDIAFAPEAAPGPKPDAREENIRRDLPKSRSAPRPRRPTQLYWPQKKTPDHPLLRLYELLLADRRLLAGLFALAILFCVLGLTLELRSNPKAETPPVQEASVPTNEPQTARPNQAMATKLAAPTPSVPGAPMQAAPNQASQADGATLLQARLAASRTLVAASYRQASTIHILTLTGQDAQERLIALLAKPDFAKETDQLYIVRKESKPFGFFLFYGIYDDAEQARQARNNMSFALRAHHPYPLPITEALRLNEG